MGLFLYKEKFHRVSVVREAVDAAVRLSDRYITDKTLPDKAIDLIDEAAAKVKIESKRFMLIKSLEQAEMQAEELTKQKSACYAQNELARANFIQIQEMEARTMIQSLQRQLGSSDERMVGTITPDAIADIVSLSTGIPVSALIKNECDQLLNLEECLSQNLIGQQNAKRLIASALRRAKAGLQKKGRPIASFLFLGPSGVGKTELSKRLADLMFGSNGLIKLDISEFS